MKIKQEKKFTLPQLIEWGFDNDITNKYYVTHDNEGNTSEVYFGIRGLPQFSSMVDKQDTFTVEVEEEITEDTDIELLLEVRNGGTVIPYYNESITSQVDKIVKEYHAYIDGEFKLIWTHEKGLVE